MSDYEAIAAQLANALREVLNLHKFTSGSLNGADFRMLLRARDTLWNFDNGVTLEDQCECHCPTCTCGDMTTKRYGTETR